MVDETISHYVVVEKLGEGGMGAVYLAEDKKLKRKAVLKFLHPNVTSDKNALERFEREAQAAAALNHPNIVTIYEIDQYEGQTFIAMEYMDGHSLREEISKGPMEINRIVEIARQLCEGLGEAHGKHIIHRDIKPANVFLTSQGVVKILDFGLAKLAGHTKLTKSGTTFGTVAYMSPEQTRGTDIDHRTDIWSLGVVLYEMATGRLPFKGEYEQAVVYSILHLEPEPMKNIQPDVLEGMQTIVDKALCKDVATRYQTADDLHADLVGLKQGISPIPARRPLKKRIFSRKGILAGAALLVLIAITGFLFKYFLKTDFDIAGPSIKGTPSISIMNFTHISPDEESKGLSKALRSWLNTTFYHVRELTVYDIQSEDTDLKRFKNMAEDLGVNTILTGEIAKLGDAFRVDFKLIDIKKDSLLYAGFVKESDKEELVYQIAADVIKKIIYDFPDEGLLRLSDFTTSSFDAYRYYLESMTYSHSYHWESAIECLQKALSYDSTFAMAYCEMGRMCAVSGRSWEETDRLFQKALRHSVNVSEREQLIIKTLVYAFSEGGQKYRYYLSELGKKYPFAFAVAALVAEEYQTDRKWEECIRYNKKWAELTNTFQPYYLIMLGFYELGKLDSAQVYTEKVIRRFPNHPVGFLYRFRLNLLEGNYEQAILDVKKIFKKRNDVENYFIGLTHFFADRLDSARFYLQKSSLSQSYVLTGGYSRASDLMRDETQLKNPRTIFDKLVLSDLAGDKERARGLCEELLSMGYFESYIPQFKHPISIARNFVYLRIPTAYFEGKMDEALQLCQQLEDIIKKHELGKQYLLQSTFWRAHIMFHLNRFEEAAEYYDTLLQEEDRKSFFRYRFAKCLYDLEKYAEAKNILLNLQKVDDVWPMPTDIMYDWEKIGFYYYYPRIYYLLGLVNEELGEKEEAMEAYRKFLDIWKEADEDLPELIDAKERLERLNGQSV